MTTYEKLAEIIETATGYLGVKKGSERHKQILSIYNEAIKLKDLCGRYNPAPRGHQMQVDEAWCATFVSVIGLLCGVDDYPCECSCNRQISQLKSMGEWEEDDAYVPSPGDIIYYDWQDSGKGENTGVADHVGIVEKVVSGTIHVIEGNMNNKVAVRTIPVNGRYIRGFGRIKFAEKQEEPKANPTVASSEYKAKVTPSNGLNVRKGPGIGYAKVTALKCGTVVTVLEEKDGWGRISSGWINLQYVKKV